MFLRVGPKRANAVKYRRSIGVLTEWRAATLNTPSAERDIVFPQNASGNWCFDEIRLLEVQGVDVRFCQLRELEEFLFAIAAFHLALLSSADRPWASK